MVQADICYTMQQNNHKYYYRAPKMSQQLSNLKMARTWKISGPSSFNTRNVKISKKYSFTIKHNLFQLLYFKFKKIQYELWQTYFTGYWDALKQWTVIYKQEQTNKKMKKKGVAHESHINQRPNVTGCNRVNRNMALRTTTKQENNVITL